PRPESRPEDRWRRPLLRQIQTASRPQRNTRKWIRHGTKWIFSARPSASTLTRPAMRIRPVETMVSGFSYSDCPGLTRYAGEQPGNAARRCEKTRGRTAGRIFATISYIRLARVGWLVLSR